MVEIVENSEPNNEERRHPRSQRGENSPPVEGPVFVQPSVEPREISTSSTHFEERMIEVFDRLLKKREQEKRERKKTREER